jgi:hypothetical protein
VAIIYLILLIASALCFLFAALPSPPPTKVNLVALGLLLWVVVYVIKAALGLPG